MTFPKSSTHHVVIKDKAAHLIITGCLKGLVNQISANRQLEALQIRGAFGEPTGPSRLPNGYIGFDYDNQLWIEVPAALK